MGHDLVRTPAEGRDRNATERLTVQAGRQLIEALQRRQQEHERQTHIRASLSAIAVAAMRRGLNVHSA